MTRTGRDRTPREQETGRCALCREPRPPRATNPAFPFCSHRCQLIDLGRWLDEDYRIPGRDGEAGTPETDED